MDERAINYFQRVVEKLDKGGIRNIQIVALDGRVMAKSNPRNEDLQEDSIRAMLRDLNITDLQRVLYDHTGEYTLVAVPLMTEAEPQGLVVVEALNLKQAEQALAVVRVALESFIEHRNAVHRGNEQDNRDEGIIRALLLHEQQKQGEDNISYKLFKSLKTYGFDLFLLRSVILIELEKKTNTYFNINLDLGYEASIETFKDKVVAVIKENKFLNNQDVVAFADNNHIVVIKSFLDVGDIGKLYQALDVICDLIVSDLEEAKIFAYRIAYGGIYDDLADLGKSYQEAANTLNLGAVFQENSGVYTVDAGVLEHIAYYLPAMVRHKSVQAILEKLKKSDGTVDVELLEVAEGFVDQCMNLMQTAKALHLHRNTVSGKIEKFKQKTGLDIEKCFKDAFLTKMAALTVKMESLRQAKKEYLSQA